MKSVDILEGWPIDYGPVAVIIWDVLESVGPGHDEVGIEVGVGIVLALTEVELIFFLVAVFWI